jgi:hypothetical protein
MASESDSKCSTIVENIETVMSSEEIKTITIAEYVEAYKNEMKRRALERGEIYESDSDSEDDDGLTWGESKLGINCKCKCHNCFPICRNTCIYEECSKIPPKWCVCFSDECRKRMINCQSCFFKVTDRDNEEMDRQCCEHNGIDYNSLECVVDEWAGKEDPKVTLTTCECKKCSGKGSDIECLLKVIIIDPTDFSVENNHKFQNPTVVKHGYNLRSTMRLVTTPYLKPHPL